jgi:hypothetical protein
MAVGNEAQVELCVLAEMVRNSEWLATHGLLLPIIRAKLSWTTAGNTCMRPSLSLPWVVTNTQGKAQILGKCGIQQESGKQIACVISTRPIKSMHDPYLWYCSTPNQIDA